MKYANTAHIETKKAIALQWKKMAFTNTTVRVIHSATVNRSLDTEALMCLET